jgi:hypothetical protein
VPTIRIFEMDSQRETRVNGEFVYDGNGNASIQSKKVAQINEEPIEGDKTTHTNKEDIPIASVPNVKEANEVPSGVQKKETKELVKFSALYRYATPGQKLMMVVASFCAAAVGSVFPLFTIIFGKLLDSLNDPTQARDPSKQAATIRSLCVYFMILAVFSSFCSVIETWAPVYVTEHVLAKVRHEFMKALLRQDMEWFDTNRGGEATSSLAEGGLQMSAGLFSCWNRQHLQSLYDS